MSGKLVLYHANPRENGAAMMMELEPATDQREGAIYLTLAPQKNKTQFDWTDGKLKVRLGFYELTKFMQVFRGECESIEGGIIYHRSPSRETTIRLDHRIAPDCHYALEIAVHPKTAGEDRRVVFLMNSAEALGICEAIASSMGKIAFGREA